MCAFPRIEALGLVVALGFAPAGCGPAPKAEAPHQEEKRPAPAGDLAFVGRVWVVEESNAVAKGSTRVFLADGTLVLAGPGSTPAFGSWAVEQGRLSIVEEGIAYPTDLDEIRDDTMKITMHSPGEPVRMTLRDARPEASGRVD